MDEKVSSLVIKVDRNCGERFREALVRIGAFDRNRKIASDKISVYLPVLDLNESTICALSLIGDYQISNLSLLPEKRLPDLEEILGFKPRFETIGDIAIVEEMDAECVGSVLINNCKKIKSVIVPISDVEGEFRTRRFRTVAGDKRTTTIHKENGLRFHVDLESVYFTPRLATERLRIAQQIRSGQCVLDMFAGIGPFSLLAAKKGAKVIAIDKNPTAVKYLRKNSDLNGIKETIDIEILEGDANEIALRYENEADHVIMNLPHSASRFLQTAMIAAKSEGIIHYYSIAHENELFMDKSIIKDNAETLDAAVEFIHEGIVRSYSPHKFNVVIDSRILKNK